MKKICLISMLWLLLAIPAALRAADSVWIEGENPTSIAPKDAPVTPSAGGSRQVLSEGKWLTANVPADKVETLMPADGITLTYTAQIPSDAQYHTWIHVGFELVRCQFEWRLDNGPWQSVKRDTPTVDLRELGIWAPVAWMDLGKQNLSAGPHTVEFHLQRSKNKEGKWEEVMFGLDAIYLTPAAFYPEGTLKPGDTSWITPEDKAAAEKTYDLPEKLDAAQTTVSLKGPWQYAGDDEGAIQDRLEPTKTLTDPASLNWHALEATGDRNQHLASQTYIHRYYMRTRLNVPATLTDRSFVLHMPGMAVIASVFVNGQYCGGTKNCWAVWDCDITKAIKPGQPNELVVAFKDAFYALAGNDHPNRLDYVPYSFWHFNTTNQLLLPILIGGQSYPVGFVLGEPSLIVGGKAYTSDVFAIPSVKNKSLALEITLHNPTASALTVDLANEIIPLAGGPAEKTFAPRQVQLPPGDDVIVKLSETWPNPKLWWPDDAQQYNVVTRISLAGKIIDERQTKFGFREWTWDGPALKLNGIRWQGFADTETSDLATLRKHGQNMVRIWWQSPDTERFQNECDAFGMPARRTATFDGQGTGGFFDLKREALWDNYRAQMTAWIKGLRNHPSIFMWSIENEITFINGHVTGNDKLTTSQIQKSVALFKTIDPTRPCMTDGGNAMLDESLEIYGGHYMEPNVNTYPEECYDKPGLAHRQAWPITQAKPMVWGETAWGGDESRVQATIGGERAFLGMAEARPATALSIRMVSEGCRWNGITAQFWTHSQIPTYYKAWQPVAVLCRQWDWSFASDQKVTRTLGIFNNTRYDDPITLTWTLAISGKQVATDSKPHQIPAGEEEKFDVIIPMPQVTTRQEGTLTLTLLRNDKPVFQDLKDISVLPAANTLLANAKLPAAGSLGIYDPHHKITDFLTAQGLKLTPVPALNNIPPQIKTLIIGPDALDPATATSSQLSAWASTGRAAIILEQKNPLKFQALPGEMETDTNHGCVAFAVDPESPLLAGLAQKDLFCWGNDNWLYRDAYAAPVSGGKSIIQCDLKLADTALVQMQPGPGLLLLSQLLIGEKLQTSIAAQYLLLNMIRYADTYKQVSVAATAVVDGNAPLAKALDNIGLKYTKESNPLKGLATPNSVAVIDASPANLKSLADNLPRVKSFTDSGGWIIFNNLTPEGLADYNKLVGVEHIIRPFHKEKVTWSETRNPITAGLPTSNILFGTGKRIMWFAPPEWPDADGYSYVVDLDEVAPFATSTYYGWQNATNNYTQSDGAWQLIEDLEPRNAVLPIKLARPEKILQFTWVSDNNYQGTTQIELTINDKTYPFDTQPTADPQTFDIPGQPTASELTCRVTGWTHDPKKNTKQGTELVGIDNVYIKVARSEDYLKKVKPILNIGAMVEYPQGKGGIILCNVKFNDSEENPVNVAKKQTVIAALLRNLQASFATGKTVIAGGNLEFYPVDISKQCNQFRGEQGWFGNKTHTFDALPPGKQTMAGVTYDIYHFTTSLVPEAIMLGDKGIPGKLPDTVTGIPVNRKADALFFLQAAKIDKHRNAKEIKQGKQYEVAQYIVHYADGKDEVIPIYAEIHVDNYRQDTPAALPGAQIAWQKDYGDKTSAVAYSMQWNNPRPDIQITTLDLTYTKDHRGTPALLALTAANAR